MKRTVVMNLVNEMI